MAIDSTEENNNEQCAWFETLLNKHSNDKSVARVINADIKAASTVGDNYASIISRATLTVILRNGQKSNMSLIMKQAHVDKEKRKSLEDIPVFKSETMIYKDFFEKCETIMVEYQDNNDKLWCNLIGYRPYELIIFEDLMKQNFVVADRVKMLDLNHSKLVLHSLGRLHALGYVLLQKGLLCKSDAEPFYGEIDSPAVRNIYTGGLKRLAEVIENHWSPEWKEIAKRLYREKDFIVEKIKKLFGPQEKSFITLCHGDCWTCNMMFKYCPYDENYPIAVKFIDFQTVHVNSYITDVMHFLYVSAQAEVRRKNFNKLLTVYQKSLQSTLKIYGMEHDAPTLEHIQSEAERVEYYSFVASVIIMPITAADVKDAFKIECANDNYDGKDAFNPEIFKSDMYKSFVQPELKAWFKKGLF